MSPRRGASRLGCLLMLLVLAAVGYFGVNVGEAYLRFYRFQDAMEQQARFSANRSDGEIRLRLQALADSLGLPPGAHRLSLRRSGGRFAVSAQYAEQIALPLFHRDFHFNPHAEFPK